MPYNKLHSLIEKALSDEPFKKKLIADPLTVFAEWEIPLPENVKIKVLENSADLIHIVLPETKKLTEEELENTIGGVTNALDLEINTYF